MGASFSVNGWAVDLDSRTGTGINDVHVYAFPIVNGSLGAPTFLGNQYGVARFDITAAFGAQFANARFSLTASLLPGMYRIGAYVYSARIGQFITSQFSDVTVVASLPHMNLDKPAVTSLGRTFKIEGWAVDRAAAPSAGAGVDVVHVWAFPQAGGPPVFAGALPTGVGRIDISSAFGSQFHFAGFAGESAPLPPGRYRLMAYAYSTVTGTFNDSQGVDVTILGAGTMMAVDFPTGATTLQRDFGVRGWAVDLGASTGSGIDAVHVWATNVTTGTMSFVGAAQLGGSRPDLAAIFGSQFGQSGFTLSISSFPAGTYDMAVYARSTVSGTVSENRVVRITVQ